MSDKSAGLCPFIRQAGCSPFARVALQQLAFISCQACAFVFTICTRKPPSRRCQSPGIFPTSEPIVPLQDKSSQRFDSVIRRGHSCYQEIRIPRQTTTLLESALTPNYSKKYFCIENFLPIEHSADTNPLNRVYTRRATRKPSQASKRRKIPTDKPPHSQSFPTAADETSANEHQRPNERKLWQPGEREAP